MKRLRRGRKLSSSSFDPETRNQFFDKCQKGKKTWRANKCQILFVWFSTLIFRRLTFVLINWFRFAFHYSFPSSLLYSIQWQSTTKLNSWSGNDEVWVVKSSWKTMLILVVMTFQKTLITFEIYCFTTPLFVLLDFFKYTCPVFK